MLFSPHQRRGLGADWLAGMLLAMAIWTKQTFLFGVAGLVLFAALWLGLRRALILASATAAATLGLGVLFAAWFGGERMWFWMVQVPTRQPWIELLSGRPWEPWAVANAVVGNIWVGVAVAAAGGAACRLLAIRPPAIAIAFLFIAAAQLPAAVAGLQKIGGTINHLGVVTLLLASAGIVMLLEAARAAPAASALRAYGFPAVATLAAAAAIAAGLPMSFVSRVCFGGPSPLARCAALAAARPGEVYFPWQPLESLVAEGRLYHIDYGLLDLRFSRFPASGEWLHAGLPPRLRYVVCPDPPFTNEVVDRLGAATVPSTDLRLPGFRVYSVSGAPEQ